MYIKDSRGSGNGCGKADGDGHGSRLWWIGGHGLGDDIGTGRGKG